MTLSFRITLFRPLPKDHAYPGVGILTPIGEFDINLRTGEIRLEAFFGFGLAIACYGYSFGTGVEIDFDLPDND